MKPSATIFTGIFGIAIWIAFVAMTGERLGGSGTGDTAVQEPGEPPAVVTAPPPATVTQPVTERRAARTAGEEIVSYPAARDDGGLERIEPRPQAQAGDANVKIVKTAVLPRPQTVEAGLIAFGSRNIRLEGIIPTPVKRQCTDENNVTWPCGVMARTQQRVFLQNRALKCDVDDPDWEGTIISSCLLERQDVAEWLARNGWAEAEAGSSLAALSTEAKNTKKGIFGSDPRPAKPKAVRDLQPDQYRP